MNMTLDEKKAIALENYKKAIALENYKKASQNVLNDYNVRTWRTFCEAKRNCMLLGVRI